MSKRIRLNKKVLPSMIILIPLAIQSTVVDLTGIITCRACVNGSVLRVPVYAK